MKYRIKQHLYKLIPALLLLVCSGVFITSAPKSSAVLAESEFIILWKDSLSYEEASSRLSRISPDFVLTDHMEDFSVCNTLSTRSETVLLALLNDSEDIKTAEVNLPTTLCGIPDDLTYHGSQWAFHNTGDYTYYVKDIPILRSATPDVDINLPEAYEILDALSPSRPVTVAIIDTGVDILHPALAEHIWTNEDEIPSNGVDDDSNGYIDDSYGWDFYNNDNTVCHYYTSGLGLRNPLPEDNDNHGTHCAGIIAATEGVFGVAGGIDIKIMPLKIHGGTKNSGSVSDAVKAIKYAQAKGADICNLSWGTSLYSEVLESVMRDSDMLFVVAAGNSGSNNNSSPLYPASYSLDNMISVAYVTQFGILASDSNYGIYTVDIAAPGQDILSTIVGGGYHYLSGTSMAAPMVSGIAALVYSCGDSLYPQNVKELMLQTLKPMDSLLGYVRYPGIPDAALLLSAADVLAKDTIAPVLHADTTYDETALLVSVQAEDLGGSGLRSLRYAAGKQDASYFCRGTAGQELNSTVLSLHKSGTYTFYASDYAGNETILVCSVQDDVTPPAISVSYAETPDGLYTISVSAEDAESGLKRLRYLPGTYSESVFLATGFDLLPGDSFVAPGDTAYTFFASDYRGNKTIYVLDIKKLPAEQLFLNVTERTLSVGESYKLVPLLLPLTATDYISYSVSDETILYAGADGMLTALSAGTAEVTVTTSGGIAKTSLFHVTELPDSSVPES